MRMLSTMAPLEFVRIRAGRCLLDPWSNTVLAIAYALPSVTTARPNSAELPPTACSKDWLRIAKDSNMPGPMRRRARFHMEAAR